MDPLRGRQSVRRSLFGPVDHDQLRRDLELTLWEMTEQDSRRWNFDFQAEMPLPGRFHWEEVPADCAASFYLGSAQMTDAVCPSVTDDDDRSEESARTDQENCSNISNTPKCTAETTPVRRKRSLSKPAPEPGTTSQITDYFPKRRRITETKNSRNPFLSTSREAAQSKKTKMSMLL